MAYNANGKVYTSHPLMDEMVYNCKKILKGIVIKNDVLATKSETENSLQNAEMFYITREDGYIPFSVFPFDEEYLRAFGYNNAVYIRRYLDDRWKIPEEDREALTDFCNQYFIDNFEEENNYYRTLMGIPKYGTGETNFIYLTKADIPGKYLKYVDITIPLHLQPKNVINVLYATGKIDEIKESHPGPYYSYLDFLGNKSIDLYTARKAAKWDILYMPNVYYMVEDAFIEKYMINRETYLTSTYQEVHSETSDYYDQLMIMLVLSETFSNLITDVPEWYIRRDIFDMRSVKYFLECYDVEFFKEIPLKYQIRIVKNINKIIKYKSCTKNIKDIIEIFTQDTVNIYKYWLYKKRLMDSKGNYIKGDSDQEKYEMEFITSDIDESFDDYIKNQIYRHTYDDITYADKYWDGEDTHQNIKDFTLEREFTIEGTKFISIDYKFSLSEYQFQIQYMLGMILDSKIDMEDIRIYVPTVDEIADFSVANLFLYAIVLSDSMYRNKGDESIDIRRLDPKEGPLPNQDHLKYREFNLYDWRVKNIPEVLQLKSGRVKAFNTNFNREAMEEFIKYRRHSHYLFGQSYNNIDYDNPGQDTTLDREAYAQRASQALTDLAINDFVVPLAKYDNIEDVINTYRRNRKCYEIFLDKVRNADNEDDYSTLEYIYQELYTREFDINFYKLSDGTNAKDLSDILKDRDYILYESYYQILNESNIDARQDIIRSILNDVVESLEYYLTGDGLEYLFAFTPIESFFNIVYYIYLMVNFFKSYEVHLLDPYMTMVVDNKMDPLDNFHGGMDRYTEMKGTTEKEDKAFISDNIALEGRLYKKEQHKFSEMVDIFGYHEEDPSEDTDYDGVDAVRGEDVTIQDMDAGTADGMKYIPYRDLDAGNSQQGKRDIDDLNGGDADDEWYEEYYEINGGNAYHPYDERTNCMGSQCFNYDLDGGSSSNIRFRSRTLDIKVISNTISMDVRISNQLGSPISVLEDGLFIKDIFVNNSEFELAKNELDTFINNINFGDQDLLTELSELGSYEDVVKRINQCVEDYLYPMLSSYDDTINDALVSRVKVFVDNLVAYLETRYENANIYSFVDL